jgi:hypothetical protein
MSADFPIGVQLPILIEFSSVVGSSCSYQIQTSTLHSINVSVLAVPVARTIDSTSRSKTDSLPEEMRLAVKPSLIRVKAAKIVSEVECDDGWFGTLREYVSLMRRFLLRVEFCRFNPLGRGQRRRTLNNSLLIRLSGGRSHATRRLSKIHLAKSAPVIY